MPARGKKRILVADDALPMRAMLEDVLNEAGYEVETAKDGEETWGKIQTSASNYDLLILDLLMPRMSGFEIMEHINASFAQKPFPILAITGIFKSEKEIQRLKNLGAIGYLSKTALVDEILFRVNSVFFQSRDNTRKFPRILLVLPVDYQHEESWHTNYSSTFSAGGVFIRTVDPLSRESRLFIKFKLPEIDEEVATHARVVWNSEYELNRPKNTLPGMGLSFENLPSEKQKRIEFFVRDRIEKEPIWF
jgi:uncharacterized protein (TIGR02266 family)